MVSWDATKNRANIAKHGLSFEAAHHVFSDPLHVSRLERIEDGEERWQTIGMVGGVAVLVAHSWRCSPEETGHEEIRIISARRATKAERKAYEQGA